MLKKLNRLLIHHFSQVEQLSSFLLVLPLLCSTAQWLIRPPSKYCPWMMLASWLTCCACVQPSGRHITIDGVYHSRWYERPPVDPWQHRE
jgi:hypothetical protein